jgi:hypothetical protein
MYEVSGIEWCWNCGAFRSLARLKGNTSQPSSAWAKPTRGDKNPYDRWQAENERRGFTE